MSHHKIFQQFLMFEIRGFFFPLQKLLYAEKESADFFVFYLKLSSIRQFSEDTMNTHLLVDKLVKARWLTDVACTNFLTFPIPFLFQNIIITPFPFCNYNDFRFFVSCLDYGISSAQRLKLAIQK